MMDCVEAQAAEAECDSMALHVSVDNVSAIAFYEREGYERSHLVKSFYGLGRNAFVYRKALRGGARDGEEWSTFVKA